MLQHKLLSGDELVRKGEIKGKTTLPEVGLKDITPNGSWLEQKQIQSALEARKDIVDVPRIEKCGTLTRATWQEDLMLAEVTHQVGGYWQHLGHSRNRKLYLKPEEALYLIEVNCLQLKYNDVPVSLQQAYSLLLREILPFKYKVYSSLSRLGYKVFRHVEKSKDDATKEHDDEIKKVDEVVPKCEENSNDVQDTAVNSTIDIDLTTDCCDTEKLENEADCNEIQQEVSEIKDAENTKLNDSAMSVTCDDEILCEPEQQSIQNSDISLPSTSANTNPPYNKQFVKQRHRKRKHIKRLNEKSKKKNVHEYFKNIPEMIQSHVVTITTPKENLPVNSCPKNEVNEINLEHVRTRQVVSPNEGNYSETDESMDAEDIHVSRRTQNFLTTGRFVPRQQVQFTQFPFTFWRPRHAFSNNFFPFNAFFQRSFFQRQFFRPTFFPARFQFFPRTQVFTNPFVQCTTNNNTSHSNYTPEINASISNTSRKRRRDSDSDGDQQMQRLNCIKKLVWRCKMSQYNTNLLDNLAQFVEKLIKTYNLIYTPKLLLTDDLRLVENEVVDTITLDDCIENEDSDKSSKNIYDENLSKIRKLAEELKSMGARNQVTSRHKRALSKVVRTFNDSFKADIYVNDKYDIIDRNINDSSSDSDCIIEENTPKEKIHGKKLRNPFNILKRLSEKISSESCSKEDSTQEVTMEQSETPNDKYTEYITTRFSRNWLPNENDFGRAEIPTRTSSLPRLDSNQQDFLYAFIDNQSCKFDSWADAKSSFLENMETAAALFQSENDSESTTELDSLIKPEDCTDMHTVLKKLSIIPKYKEEVSETCLKIDFDVYNRDVKNLRKSNLPKPHFRIICLSESSGLPSGADIATLHSKYNDSVPMIFAVIGDSVSYLQIKPMDLPMYIPGSEIEE